MANQILVIAPYWLDSVETWVFDDEAVDLDVDPLIAVAWNCGLSQTCVGFRFCT
jgi:hypothetical protein